MHLIQNNTDLKELKDVTYSVKSLEDQRFCEVRASLGALRMNLIVPANDEFAIDYVGGQLVRAYNRAVFDNKRLT